MDTYEKAKKNKQFAAFLERKQREINENKDLLTYLYLPIQRMIAYDSLLKVCTCPTMAHSLALSLSLSLSFTDTLSLSFILRIYSLVLRRHIETLRISRMHCNRCATFSLTPVSEPSSARTSTRSSTSRTASPARRNLRCHIGATSTKAVCSSSSPTASPPRSAIAFSSTISLCAARRRRRAWCSRSSSRSRSEPSRSRTWTIVRVRRLLHPANRCCQRKTKTKTHAAPPPPPPTDDDDDDDRIPLSLQADILGERVCL